MNETLLENAVTVRNQKEGGLREQGPHRLNSQETAERTQPWGSAGLGASLINLWVIPSTF